MASIGHVVVGMAAARIYPATPLAGRSWITAAAGWTLLSMLPDADVIGFALGVRYEDEWGHRGATHSLAFSLALGVAIGALAPRFNRPALRTGIIASLVLVSHALLDTLTNGGLGCALFWPFDLTRYFAPWTPIPVAPIGLAFLSPYGFVVAATEIVLFAPLLWFALTRHTATSTGLIQRRRAHRIGSTLLVALWLAATWLLISGDTFRDRITGMLIGEETQFTAGFSEDALQAIEPGAPLADVAARLGPPFDEVLFYGTGPETCAIISVADGVVTAWRLGDACMRAGIVAGMARDEAVARLGTPAQTCWRYTRSPGSSRPYRLRGVCFEDGKVVQVARGWLRD